MGHKFYCTIRANHYVNRGNWYFEAKIVDLPDGAATRIGWAQRNANLQVYINSYKNVTLPIVLIYIE